MTSRLHPARHGRQRSACPGQLEFAGQCDRSMLRVFVRRLVPSAIAYGPAG